MFGIGSGELVLILLIVLLLFGGSKLPKLGKSLGEGIRGFKDGLKGDAKPEDKDKKDTDATPKA